jgi:hypothetical protein
MRQFLTLWWIIYQITLSKAFQSDPLPVSDEINVIKLLSRGKYTFTHKLLVMQFAT